MVHPRTLSFGMKDSGRKKKRKRKEKYRQVVSAEMTHRPERKKKEKPDVAVVLLFLCMVLVFDQSIA
jgi:hypothetical protein